MYLRCVGVAEGSPLKIFDALKDVGDASDKSLKPKIEKSKRGTPILIFDDRNITLSVYFMPLAAMQINKTCFRFDLQMADYSLLKEADHTFAFGEAELNLNKKQLIDEKFGKLDFEIIDMNLPQGFHNMKTHEAVKLCKPTVELLSHSDLVNLSLLSQPYYPSGVITMDYVDMARKILAKKGFVDPEEFDILDDEFNFVTNGELIDVSLDKI